MPILTPFTSGRGASIGTRADAFAKADGQWCVVLYGVGASFNDITAPTAREAVAAAWARVKRERGAA